MLFDKEFKLLVAYPYNKHSTYQIPNSVVSIGEGAFDKCYGLTSIEIPNSVTSIGDHAFSGCNGLISIRIPNSVTSIGNYAFDSCSRLTSIKIPNSVTSIGIRAFGFCESLTSVEIPNSVTSIRYYAFEFCSNLTEVYYNSENPRNVSSDAFPSECYVNATLYLPEAGISKAASVEPWCLFNSIKAYDFNGVDEIEVDVDKNAPVEVFTLAGMKVADALDALPAGIYLIRQNGKTTKVTVK